jgi:hypothetical protein
MPDSLAHSAFDAIANDSFAQRSRSREAEANGSLRSPGAQTEGHKEPAREARSSIVGFPEFRTAKDPAGFRE